MSGHKKHSHTHTQKIDVDHLIGKVQALSKQRGERMTSVRHDVVVALAKHNKPYGAYQILAEINKKRVPKLSAMSLYRTLDFLIELGVVIKLESQNAYKLCAGHDHDHSHLMMICDGCGDIQEIDDCATERKLQSLTQKYGHTLKHNVIELHGLCMRCEA